eukprot:CAMPEP_0185847444 /NCGR_PEP_ID=MMETSP1354-20130828/2722_1 /TAXON_ID=708628 /ORGANISM="Erythrolobus madagascarensis, Strain CCMP3276" /LENGTH=61 /DNA_ID=CAMNT_0028547739 /DNA_START=67 /DNA_END=249 /DNA_ORIENTATION=+
MSTGLRMSMNPEIDNPQLAAGPQKCVVRGPVGEFIHRSNTFPPCAAACLPPPDITLQYPRP